MFLCKRARQDLLPGIVFLATRVCEVTDSDWKKLTRLMDYPQSTRDKVAKMSIDNTQTIKWYIDSFFAVYKNIRSHTGAIMTLGQGAIISDSTK